MSTTIIPSTSSLTRTRSYSSDSSSKPLRKPTNRKGPYSYYSIA